MSPRIPFVVLCAAAFAAACSDAPPSAPTTLAPRTAASAINEHAAREKYVAIGTSISMGWSSNGVFAGSQLTAWPALLSFGPLRQISLPLIQAPGCTPPLVAPLGANKRLDGGPFSGSNVCAPNEPGVTLPTQNVALAGTLAIDALQTTPQIAGAAFPWYARVLPPGATQVTAALAQNPTIVSIELGGNDVLLATSGLVAPGVTVMPVPLFEQAYDAVLNAIGSAHPKVLLLGLPTDGTHLPSLRRAAEVWADAAEFAALHVDVSPDCQTSPNYINVSVKSLVLVFTAAFTSTHGLPNPVFSCADIPGTQDLVLTPTDMATLNDMLGQMAEHAKEQAASRGYAFLSLGELYDRPDLKPPTYSVVTQLSSSTPYGPYISLDGVHPGPLGHAVLAFGAARAINKTYPGTSAHTVSLPPIPSIAEQVFNSMTPSMALELAKRVAKEHQGETLSPCLMPGSCFVGAARKLP